MRILIVEDSVSLVDSLCRGLRKLGHAVDVARDGPSGLRRSRSDPYDVIVLDIMLPEMSGLEILERVRAERRPVYVLMLTAKDAVEDRVRGLNLGADDYLVKPFAFDELVARLDALARRPLVDAGPSIEVGDVVIDTAARRVWRGGEEIRLAAREYSLLAFLASRAGQVVSREEIEDHLYDEHNFPMSNAVQSAISCLRSSLDRPGRPSLIHTRRGLGYVLEARAPCPPSASD